MYLPSANPPRPYKANIAANTHTAARTAEVIECELAAPVKAIGEEVALGTLLIPPRISTDIPKSQNMPKTWVTYVALKTPVPLAAPAATGATTGVE